MVASLAILDHSLANNQISIQKLSMTPLKKECELRCKLLLVPKHDGGKSFIIYLHLLLTIVLITSLTLDDYYCSIDDAYDILIN